MTVSSHDLIDNDVKNTLISWRKNQNKGSLQDIQITDRDTSVMQKRLKSNSIDPDQNGHLGTARTRHTLFVSILKLANKARDYN